MTAREDLQVGVRGWIEAKLINREGKVVHEHTQSNLILDRGLDFIMAWLYVYNMLSYIAVGTGSTAPNPTQTALANEIARTNATLGLGEGLWGTVLGDGHYRLSRTRAFDYNQANGNLTEFGGSDSSSPGAGVLTRELFRDANGNPIVITKTSNERLVITYHIEVKLSPTVATDYGTVNILDGSGNIVGSRLVRHLFTKPVAGYGTTIDLTIVASRFYLDPNGGVVDFGPYGGVYHKAALLTTPVDLSYTGDGQRLTIHSPDAQWSTYTAGTFYRELSYEQGPEVNDITVYGYMKGVALDYLPNTYGGRSYAAAFVNPDGSPNPFVKNKDYRFRVTTRFSISRL